MVCVATFNGRVTTVARVNATENPALMGGMSEIEVEGSWVKADYSWNAHWAAATYDPSGALLERRLHR